MISFFSNYSLEVKAFHIFCMTAWMAGLFYFPRLLVYHVQNQYKPEITEIFKTMEKRLYRIIMMPAMIFSLISGIILATGTQVWSSPWMHLKLLAVTGLTIFHFLLNYWRHKLATNNYQHSEKFFRIVNEIPTILLIIIVTSVVLKPF
jgi:putative membrane protein